MPECVRSVLDCGCCMKASSLSFERMGLSLATSTYPYGQHPQAGVQVRLTFISKPLPVREALWAADGRSLLFRLALIYCMHHPRRFVQQWTFRSNAPMGFTQDSVVCREVMGGVDRHALSVLAIAKAVSWLALTRTTTTC